MAAKLQCEICGGKLIGKPGGIFECENCGTEYSTEWAKTKIQEIIGTVKVEGTVEVSGKVQIDGPVKVEGGANKEALLQRGLMALEEENWDDAKDFFNQALNFDAQYAEAYLGLAMAASKSQNRKSFSKIYTKPNSEWRENSNVLRSRQFDTELNAWFEKLDEFGRIADEKEAERQRKQQTAYEQQLEQRNKRFSEMRKTCPSFFSRMISAEQYNIVGIKRNGTVVAAGDGRHGECNIRAWKEIDAVSVGFAFTVGQKNNGTIIATGLLGNGKSDVQSWKQIISVAAYRHRVIGLRANGTVVAAGEDPLGACDVSGWTGITAIAIGGSHSIGLRADGTVIATQYKGKPEFYHGQCEVSEWKNIVAIAAGEDSSFGIRADGTVVAAGQVPQSKVAAWKDIVALAPGSHHTVGLRADGTVVATGSNDHKQCAVSKWNNIVAIAVRNSQTIGLKADGTIVIAGYKDNEGERASVWILFSDGESLYSAFEEYRTKMQATRNAISEAFVVAQEAAKEREIVEAERKRAMRQARIDALNKEKESLQAELLSLKGLFAGKRRKEIEARLAVIEADLKKHR